MRQFKTKMNKLLIVIGIFCFLGSASCATADDITDLEGTTGYVGKEDINWGTGQTTDTFTVTTYDGSSATLTKLPDPDAADESIIKGVWFVAAMAGDHGNTALTGSLAWVIATLDGDAATVVLPGNQTYQISTDLTVPATVHLVMHRGALFSVDAAKTLTINGDVLAGAYQIFSGSGTITLGANILEHDMWRDGAGDDILPSDDDAIDLGSSSQRFKNGYFEDIDIANAVTFTDITVTDQVTTARITGHPFPGLIVRPKFTYKDDDEIYISAGVYYHDGTTEQLLYWDSQITYQFTSLAASDWSYLYLDDSAIVTADTNLISTSEFTDSLTEPDAYSQTKHGRYNGEDLCVFAVLTDGSSHILEFFHDGGDYVSYADGIADITAQDVDQAWEDAESALSIPAFSIKANISLSVAYGDQAGSLGWRTNGQTGSTGHYVLYCDADVSTTQVPVDVVTDSSQLIELIFGGAASTNTVNGYTNGWYFPHGM